MQFIIIIAKKIIKKHNNTKTIEVAIIAGYIIYFVRFVTINAIEIHE